MIEILREKLIIYIKYISEGDKDDKLSPEECLNMIRPDLRDLINRHKPDRTKFFRVVTRQKKAIINNNNNNNNVNNFQNALDDALIYQTIETHPERISKSQPYVNKYHWKVIEFPAGSKEWQKFEENNKTIAVNILYVKRNTKKISAVYKSKHNNKREKQVILLMIGDGKIKPQRGFLLFKLI